MQLCNGKRPHNDLFYPFVTVYSFLTGVVALLHLVLMELDIALRGDVCAGKLFSYWSALRRGGLGER